MRFAQLEEARRLVQRLPGRSLEHHGPEGVDVRRGRHVLPAELLRGHVQRRADERPVQRDGGGGRDVPLRGGHVLRRVRPGDAEIGDDRAPIARAEKYVRRLQIAMDHARLVRRSEAHREVVSQPEELRGLQRGAARRSRPSPRVSPWISSIERPMQSFTSTRS